MIFQAPSKGGGGFINQKAGFHLASRRLQSHLTQGRLKARLGVFPQSVTGGPSPRSNIPRDSRSFQNLGIILYLFFQE